LHNTRKGGRIFDPDFESGKRLAQHLAGGESMSFGLYLMGFLLLVAGIAYGLTLVHVPGQWIAIAVVVLIGLGIMTGVSRTRMRDPS
jgi:hypothetical protein